MSDKIATGKWQLLENKVGCLSAEQVNGLNSLILNPSSAFSEYPPTEGWC